MMHGTAGLRVLHLGALVALVGLLKARVQRKYVDSPPARVGHLPGRTVASIMRRKAARAAREVFANVNQGITRCSACRNVAFHR